jgi:hypothetical protein
VGDVVSRCCVALLGAATMRGVWRGKELAVEVVMVVLVSGLGGPRKSGVRHDWQLLSGLLTLRLLDLALPKGLLIPGELVSLGALLALLIQQAVWHGRCESEVEGG